MNSLTTPHSNKSLIKCAYFSMHNRMTLLSLQYKKIIQWITLWISSAHADEKRGNNIGLYTQPLWLSTFSLTYPEVVRVRVGTESACSKAVKSGYPRIHSANNGSSIFFIKLINSYEIGNNAR